MRETVYPTLKDPIYETVQKRVWSRVDNLDENPVGYGMWDLIESRVFNQVQVLVYQEVLDTIWGRA